MMQECDTYCSICLKKAEFRCVENGKKIKCSSCGKILPNDSIIGVINGNSLKDEISTKKIIKDLNNLTSDFNSIIYKLIANENYKKRNDTIFVITTIVDIIPECEGSQFASSKAMRSRSVGWYQTFEEAERVILKNICDIREGYYQYVVIEELNPGIYPNSKKEYWYIWKDECYQRLSDKPELVKHIVNFSIG